MLLSSQQRLNEHLSRWDKTVRTYRRLRADLGAARADYEHARAVLKVQLRHEDPKLPANMLDTLADADDGVYQAHVKYRLAEGEVQAYVARLDWCRAQGESLRSEVSTERAEAQLYYHSDQNP